LNKLLIKAEILATQKLKIKDTKLVQAKALYFNKTNLNLKYQEFKKAHQSKV
jgi:hypothetical protein